MANITNDPAEFALYSYFRSSASFRTRIALNLKGIPYDTRPVALLKSEQRTGDYAKLNPSQQVPTLVHRGHCIGQSLAIIDYLDAVQPEPRLFPREPLQRALVLQACEIVNSGIQPLHNLAVLQDLGTRFGLDEEGKNKWTVHWMEKGSHALEELLKNHAGKFSFGDHVSAADCFLIPALVNNDRFKINAEKFPTLERIRQNCEALEAFKRAAPAAQPDYVA